MEEIRSLVWRHRPDEVNQKQVSQQCKKHKLIKHTWAIKDDKISDWKSVQMQWIERYDQDNFLYSLYKHISSSDFTWILLKSK